MAMRITLKKAHIIQQTLDTIIKNINIQSECYIAEFQSVQEVIDQKTALALESIQRKLVLIEVRYKIRDMIDLTNISNEINRYLTQIVSLNKRIAFLELVITNAKETKTDVTALQNKLLKVQSSTSDYNDNVRAHIFNMENTNSLREDLYELKKQKSELSDKVAALNVTTIISFSDEIENVLKGERVI